MLKIYLSKTNREQVRSKFNIPGSTLSLALNFKTQSEKADRIRSYSLNNVKGILVDL